MMDRNNKKKYQRIFLLLSVLLFSFGTSGVKAEEFEVQTGSNAEWIINSVSDQSVAWYRIDIWTDLGSWVAENNSKIHYTVTEIHEEIYGDLIIGNLTISNSSSAEIASDLAIGVLMWGPGLITHTNWTKHKIEAQEQAQSDWLNGTLKITESTKSYISISLETIKFAMVSASQNTSLVYDKNSGILLEAQTGFGSYFLDIELSSTDPPLKEVELSSTDPPLKDGNGQFLAVSWMDVLLPFIFISGIGLWRGRKRYNKKL